MLSKFLNQNLLPEPKGNSDSKKEITSNEVETIIALIEEYDNHKLGTLTYEHQASSLSMTIQSGIPQEIQTNKSPTVEHQPIIITESMMPRMEEIDLNDDMVVDVQEPVKQISNGTLVTAHMSGSVFLKPAPTENNFVNLGDFVQVDQVLCLLEAMKLFSEVKATTSGTISKIFVAHGDIVQEGDSLFEIL